MSLWISVTAYFPFTLIWLPTYLHLFLSLYFCLLFVLSLLLLSFLSLLIFGLNLYPLDFLLNDNFLYSLFLFVWKCIYCILILNSFSRYKNNRLINLFSAFWIYHCTVFVGVFFILFYYGALYAFFSLNDFVYF